MIKQRREKFELRKVRCKIIFIDTIYRKSRKSMTFKFHEPPSRLKNYTSIKHVNVLVIRSSTECPTSLTNCLITFRMKSIPRVCQSISMPPMTATPIQSCSRRKRKIPTDERESFTWVFHQIDDTVYSLPSFRLLEVMVSVHAENGGETVSS